VSIPQFSLEELRSGLKKNMLKITQLLNEQGIAEDLKLRVLKRQVVSEVALLVNRIRFICESIYVRSPTPEETDKLLELVSIVTAYEDFMSADQLKIWEILSRLVSAYKQGLL
jgi:hypothetical protein